MTLTLYHAAYSTCSQKVRLVLAEKRLEFTSHQISFAKNEQLDPAYLKINPSGVVPSLVHDGDVVTDSSVIVEYLEEMFPSPALAPDTAKDRAKMRSWLRFMEEVPTKAVRIPSFQTVFLPTLRLIKRKGAFQKEADQRTLRQGFYGKMRQGEGFSDPEIAESQQHLAMTIARIETALARGPWVMGDQLTLVDLTLAPLIDRMLDLNMLDHFEGADRTLDWMQRLQDRPSYDQAFFKGSRLSERPEFQYARLRNWFGRQLAKGA